MSTRAVTAGNPGARVPIWRKTRAAQVDDKVDRLFESYRLIDQAIWNDRDRKGLPLESGLSPVDEEMLARRNKYF